MEHESQAAGSVAEVERRQIGHWIAGETVLGTSGRILPVYDPAIGEPVADVNLAANVEVDIAVSTAVASQRAWAEWSLARRAEVFFTIRRLFADRADALAKLVTAEHGKVLSDAAGEVARGLEIIDYCCGLADLLKGAFSEQASTGIDVYSIRQPVGIVAGITPFNFPLMVPIWMWAPALACGNAFVLKPSEKDPSVSLEVAALLKDAGVPDGIFSVVNGDQATVQSILSHPQINAISFVGSTPVARLVYETAAHQGKRCQALGGAKNHMVVMPDADLGSAADAAVSAAFGSAGERCMAISHVVAVGAVAEPLIQAIAERTAAIKVGNGLNPESTMGPLITRQHRDRVASYVERGRLEGATVVIDGRENLPLGDGFWLRPSLLDRVDPDNIAYKDEIFGPVLGVTRVATLDDALDLIEKHPMGNGAAIFTRNGGIARLFQHRVSAGMVGVNVPIPVPVAYYSFGGWKNSLFGDSHIYGPDGLRFYTRGKVVTSRWDMPRSSALELSFPTTG